MTTTLYRPDARPQSLPASIFLMQPGSSQVVQDAARAAELLGCAPGLVDVLACGNGYLVYSVFDDEGEVNPAAMAAVAEVSGIGLDPTNEDEVLRGPVLIIRA